MSQLSDPRNGLLRELLFKHGPLALIACGLVWFLVQTVSSTLTSLDEKAKSMVGEHEEQTRILRQISTFSEQQLAIMERELTHPVVNGGIRPKRIP